MKPDKGRAMPVSLVRLHAFKPKTDQLYIIPILRTLYNVGSFIFFLNKTIDTPYLTFSKTRRNEMCS